MPLLKGLDRGDGMHKQIPCSGVIRTGKRLRDMLRCWQAGLDSLGAVELRNAVVSTFGIAVPASVAFDYPTQEALAAYIGSELAARAAAVKPSALVSVRHHQPGRMTTDIVSIACEYPGGENTGDSTTRCSLCPLQASGPQSHSLRL